MFGSLYFRGCKYTNKILFINKNIVFQHFVLLITCHLERFPVRPGMTKRGRSGMTEGVGQGMTREPFPVISTGFLSVISTEHSLSSQPNTLCHLDRAERVERSPLPAFLSEKHNAIPPEAQRQTVRQLLGQFYVGRCRKRR